jgi:hypothetical protein
MAAKKSILWEWLVCMLSIVGIAVLSLTLMRILIKLVIWAWS